jgi:hypothetical protein
LSKSLEGVFWRVSLSDLSQNMSRPSLLYRYRSVSDEGLFDREMDTLKNSYLYAPAFKSMNDPMEAFYETGGPADGVVEGIFGTAGQLSREVYSQLHEMVAKFGLVSFSSAPDDLPLWAYYAGNFRGLCLEFDTEALTVGDFQGEDLVPVKYARTALPPLSLADLGLNQMQKAVLARITRKRSEWQHEKEWRYVTGSVGPRYYNDDALKRVFLGPEISEQRAVAVCEALKNRPVEILQGTISRFELRFRTVKDATPLDRCEKVGQASLGSQGSATYRTGTV